MINESQEDEDNGEKREEAILIRCITAQTVRPLSHPEKMNDGRRRARN